MNEVVNTKDSESRNTVAHMLGEVAFLFAQSPTHRHLTFGDIEWLLIPPMALEQYRVYRDGEEPKAVVLWAHLSEEAESKLMTPRPKLSPADWNSGDRVWIIEVVAPGATDENRMVDGILTELTQTALQGKTINFHKINHLTDERESVTVTPEMLAQQMEAASAKTQS